MKTTLNKVAAAVHAANSKWWTHPVTGKSVERNKGELLALVHSEISEGYEGKQRGCKDDKLPHRRMDEVEIVDAIIRTFDYAAGFGYDLDAAAFGFCHEAGFDGLNGFIATVDESYVTGYPNHSDLHCGVSRVLELERKGTADDVPTALVALLVNLFLYAFRQGYDVQGTFDDKMAYNAVREDHKHEARRADGGKKF